MSKPNVRFSQGLADAICARLETGETLRAVCRTPDMPSAGTVVGWVKEDRGPGFAEQYARARELGYKAMAEEIITIADDGANDYMQRLSDSGEVQLLVDHDHIARSRLRVDTRKWLLSKALPKIYGDKVTLAGDPEAPLVVQEDRRSIKDFVQEFGKSKEDKA